MIYIYFPPFTFRQLSTPANGVGLGMSPYWTTTTTTIQIRLPLPPHGRP
jgi:hypothetical protein